MDKPTKFLEHNERLLISQLGIERYAELRRAATAEMENLQPLAPRFKQTFNRQSFSFGVPCLAIYRALKGPVGIAPDVALDTVCELVDRTTRREVESHLAARVMLRSLARSRLATWIYKRSMTSLKEPLGWRIDLLDEDAHIAFDVCQCGLVLYLADQGAPELSSVFCHADVVASEYMEGLRFERQGTLADGAEVCDFRYRLVQESMVSM